MPIRRRAVNVTYGNDNVINARQDDGRGVWDPAKDPYKGSIAEWVVGRNPDATGNQIRSRMGHMTYVQAHHDKIPHPNDVNVQNLLMCARINYNYPADNVEYVYRQRLRSPLTAIRAQCVINCKAGSPKAVSYCSNLTCPLWPFRMGKHGLR